MPPTFSVILETSNLSVAELESLDRCLASLERQTVPIESAAEVVLLDSGDAPPGALETLVRRYPWAQVNRVEPGTRYGDVKAIAGDHGSGAVIVLCDADVQYADDWLEQLLAAFERDDVQIAAGETTTPIHGPYSLAIALTFHFPRHSGETGLQPALFYWANNVAARREFLAELPLPQDLPVYRGQTIIHSKALRDAGHTIWRVPGAIAWHDLPTLREVLPRFVIKGYDATQIARLVGDPVGHTYMGGMEPRDDDEDRVRNLRRRARSVFAEDSKRFVHLPAALPVLAVLVAAYGIGRLRATLRRPPRAARPQPVPA